MCVGVLPPRQILSDSVTKEGQQALRVTKGYLEVDLCELPGSSEIGDQVETQRGNAREDPEKERIANFGRERKQPQSF